MVMQWLVGAVELLNIEIAAQLIIMGDYDVSDSTDEKVCGLLLTLILEGRY